jgi:carbon starvation protein
MDTFLVAVLSFVGFLVAYFTYGRWLARKIFDLDPQATVPSHALRDDVDFVPTPKSVIFGHHFTSIAGTGPIVGPAIAVFWGWLPALLWVVFGSIFIGAVHDFGTLVISLRNRGQTVGEIAGRLISPRAKLLFLFILFFALTVVLAIFGLVIASLFKIYPQSVLSVWVAMPIAMAIGIWGRRQGAHLLVPSLIALLLVYGALYIGVEHLPIGFVQHAAAAGQTSSHAVDFYVGSANSPLLTNLPLINPTIAWTAILMAYCFAASVLPVWLLLQPRDFINSHQLIVALVLLLGGLGLAGLTGKAQLSESAPAVVAHSDLPAHTPPIFPFLFITIACGACSGFHCLVSSGTSSKQVNNEQDSQYVAYGSMLLEGALAVIVILACTAGVGMGQFTLQPDGRYAAILDPQSNAPLTGRDAWLMTYSPEGDWAEFGLGRTVKAFVDGGANFLSALGIPLRHGVGIIATLVACFAATTLDTATRLQRYIVQEIAESLRLPVFTNKYAATALVIVGAMSLALMKADPSNPNSQPGTGGQILWPLFGATNQLLAGLAFMVVTFYLWRRNKPVAFVAIPMVIMLLMPAVALYWNICGKDGWYATGNYTLLGFGIVISLLQLWMMIEGLLVLPRTRGVLETPLPPLPARHPVV